MLLSIFLCITLCFIPSQCTTCTSYSYSGSGYPFTKRPRPVNQILSALALRTNEARPVLVPRCDIHVPDTTQFQLYNTGQGVEGVPISGGEIRIRGGPIFGDYILRKFRYQNDDVPINTRAAQTENGVGTAVTQLFQFYKESCGSAENCLNDFDGFVVLLVPVQPIKNAYNPDFEPYRRALNAVKQLNATTIINAKQSISWLLKVISNCRYYYAYQGTIFGDPLTDGGIAGKQYPSAAAIIQLPLSCSAVISFSQYGVYPSILNQFGELTTTVLGLHPSKGRDIVKCTNGFGISC